MNEQHVITPELCFDIIMTIPPRLLAEVFIAYVAEKKKVKNTQEIHPKIQQWLEKDKEIKR